jgi:hypothetical protein
VVVTFKNKSSFTKRNLYYLLILLSIFLIIVIISKGSFLGKGVFVFIVFLIIIFQKFTALIIIDKTQNVLMIQYHEFLLKKTKKLELDKVETRLKQHYAFKGGAYSILQILIKGKVVYEIDSRDGFELTIVAHSINHTSGPVPCARVSGRQRK